MIVKICQPVKLIHKFFLAFFITNLTLVGVMFTFFYISFSSGFNDFVQQQEERHVASVKHQLVELYREVGSWQSITKNIQLWRTIVAPTEKPDSRQPDNQAKQRDTVSVLWGLPANSLKTGQRISLYNKDKVVIVGRSSLNDNPHVEPIELNGEIIGWLGLVPSRLIQTSPATAFLTTQFHNYFMITSVVIALAFIMAIMLSRHLTKPIKQIVSGTNALIKGNFTDRITPLSKDELGTLSTNFNQLAQTLEQNKHMRQQWVSDTSHELRTPLTVLRSHLIAIQDGVFEPDPARINLLINHVENLSHIVDDLAQLSHADIAYLTYENTQVDLIDVLKQSLAGYLVRFHERGLSVNSEGIQHTESAIVMGDKKRLEQLFSNLFENSCRYTHSPGKVTLATTITQDTISVTLNDSAPGVLSHDLQKLFERFYRVEKSRSREHGGAGLGLALCKQITEAHSGQIVLDHSALGGLEITMTFPLVG